MKSVAACIAAVALWLTSPPATAQRASERWRPLIPTLKAQLDAKPDVEVALRLAMVYAHEGLLIDWWHMLKQIDRMVGGEDRRAQFGRQVKSAATQRVKQDPGNLLARYELAFGSWFAHDHRTAMQQFLEITKREPRNAINHGYLGYLY